MEINRINDRSIVLVGPYSKRRYMPVWLVDEAQLGISPNQFVTEPVRSYRRLIKRASFKHIAESCGEPGERLRSRVKRYRLAAVCGDLPQIVDAVAMVGMVVRHQHTIERPYACRQQLLPEVRPAIDQQPQARAFKQDGGPCSAVSGVAGIALAPVISDPRHAGRRPAAEDPDLHVAALLNSLKKLAVVASPSSSSGSSRRSDRNAAVSATNAGSQGWPRCGTGARKGESVSTSSRSCGMVLAVSCKSLAFLKVTIPEMEM